MNQKGLAPILIVLILAVLVGGYLVYQNQIKPTPSPQPTTQPSPSPAPTGTGETANWKTFTTNEYSLKYPEKWYIENPNADVGNWINFFPIGAEVVHTDNHKFGNETLRILVYEGESLFNSLSNGIVPKPTTLTVEGKQALKQAASIDILIKELDNGKDRVLHLEIIDKNSISLLNQILSTFKFLP